MTHADPGPQVADALVALLLRPAGAAQPARDWTSQDWSRARAIAREHRLGPLLHWRLTRDGIDVAAPAEAGAAFAAAFRASTLRALALQAELAAAARRLREAGIESLALKGAQLALTVYPHPAMRPMRDIDLLVRQEEVRRAYALFVAAGYAPQPSGFTGDARHVADQRRHETPLCAPGSGIVVELHGRLHEVDDLARPDASTAVPDSVWRDRGVCMVAGEAVGVLSPTDLLLHLVVHACYHHHFDNGPCSFVDVARLLASGGIDWPHLRARCDACGWTRGLQLVLHAIDRHQGTAWAREAGAIPGPELDALARTAVALSVQPQALRRELRLADQMTRAGGLGGRVAALWPKIFPSRAAIAALEGRELRSWAFVPAYLGRWAHLSRAAAAMARTRADPQLAQRLRVQRPLVRQLVAWLHPKAGRDGS
jgi:hypothetical protein